MDLYFIGDSGQTTLYGSVRRDVDGYVFNNVASAFQIAPSTANKALTVNAVSGYPGVYKTSVTPTTWDDGKYHYLVQDSGNAHQTMGMDDFFIQGGVEATISSVAASTADSYYADIDVNIDRTNSLDEYTVSWFKNGNTVEAGITSPMLHVMDRAGTAILNNVAMSGVSNGVYKYDAPQTLARGSSYVVTTRATIDSAQRTSRKIVGRDN